MKNLKFSRLFAAAMFVAVLVLSGCKPADDETPYAIEGTWVDGSGQKWEITHNELKNYWNDTLGYTGDHLVVEELSATVGTIFIKYTTSYEASLTEPNPSTGWIYSPAWDTYPEYWYRYSESAPDVGKWYAVSYKDLTDTSVKICGAYKNSGETACATLEAAKTEFTIDNGYFPSDSYAACTRQ